MKYSKKYPGLGILQVSEEDIMRALGSSPCETCGEPTEFIEINYIAPFCSEECLASYEAEMDADFFKLDEETKWVCEANNDKRRILKAPDQKASRRAFD